MANGTGTRAFILRGLLVAAAVAALGGCSTLGYYAHLASGEAHLLARREPIPRVVDNPRTPETLRRRLELVQRARAFASSHLDLPRNRSYTTYVALDRPFVMYNVFATPPLSLQPVRHCFLFAGCVAYQGYYSLTRAQARAKQLRAKGDDVYIGGVPAYSTLGHFADPVLSSMMGWGDDQLVGTIFHELAHQKLYLKGDTTFDESFATFVQREGLRQWHAANGTRPADPGAERRQREFTRLVLATRRRLHALYASDASDAAKYAGKQAAFAELKREYDHLRDTQWHGHHDYDAWIAGPPNNAKLLPFGLYDRWIPAFARLFAQSHDDWPTFYRAVRTLSKLPAAQRQARLAALKAAHDGDHATTPPIDGACGAHAGHGPTSQLPAGATR